MYFLHLYGELKIFIYQLLIVIAIATLFRFNYCCWYCNIFGNSANKYWFNSPSTL